MKIENRFTGETIYEDASETIVECVEAAVKAGAHLRGADLRGAYLGGAHLRGADLRGAYLRGAYLRGADLGGAYLGGAHLRGAHLGGADLGGADLGGADLGGAYLRGAYLRGASYGDGIPISVPPLFLSGLHYDVIILDDHIKIGCEMHGIDDWTGYDEDRIREMDGSDALTFWRQWCPHIFALAQEHRKRCHESSEAAGETA